MKILLDEKVYNVPSPLVISWIRMTPALSGRLRALWDAHRKSHHSDSKLTPAQYDELVHSFPMDRRDEYYQLQIDAVFDMRESMGEDFEDYAIEMTEDELMQYAKKGNFPSYSTEEANFQKP